MTQAFLYNTGIDVCQKKQSGRSVAQTVEADFRKSGFFNRFFKRLDEKGGIDRLPASGRKQKPLISTEMLYVVLQDFKSCSR